MSKRKKYIKSCEVSKLVMLNLGGFPQKVLIEGFKADLPVVIFLHGGPGSPVPFSVGCRGLFPEWSEKAVMVFWDQLGCGINDYPIDDTFTIDSFVKMTVDLITEIKSMFPQNKLYLFGVSWGSILALKAATLCPEKLNGVLTYGQVLKNLFFNDEVKFAFSNAPQKAQAQAAEIFADGANCDYKTLDKNLKALHKLLNKYTDAYNNKSAKPAPIGKIVMGLLSSPDYTFKNFKAVIKNGYAHNTSLWHELLNLDLTPLLAEVKIKYLLLQGDTDIITSTANVLNAVRGCNNQNVSVKVLKDSGHMPSAAAMEECFAALCDFIA